MPFFLKPCLKLRIKKKKKTEKHNQILRDITTPVNTEEITSQLEFKPNHKSTFNQDDTVNDSNDPVHHSVDSIVSRDTITECSCITAKDNENNIRHDTESQNSENSSDVNEKEHSVISNLETNTFDIFKPLEDIEDYSTNSVITINEQNVSKLFDSNQDIANSTINVTEVIQVSQANDILENIFIQKSYEIIRKITVNSDVFEAIEMLQEIEKNRQLYPEISQEKLDTRIKRIEFGNAKPEKGDSNNIINTDLKQSEIHVGYDNQTPTCFADTLQISEESKENENFPLKDIRDSSCIYLKYIGNPLIGATESSESDISTVLCESEHDTHSSNNLITNIQDNHQINAGLENKETGFVINNSEISVETEGSEIINKIISTTDLINIKYINENKDDTNWEIESFKEITADNCSTILNLNKCQSDIYDKCKILQDETNCESKCKIIDNNNDDAALQLKQNANDFLNATKYTEGLKNFSVINSELEREISNFQDKNIDNSDFVVSKGEYKCQSSFDIEEETELNVYQISDTENDEQPTSDKKNIMTETEKSVTDNIIDFYDANYHLTNDLSHADIKTEELPANLNDGDSLKTYERICIADSNASEIAKCIINDKCYTDNKLSLLKTKELNSENDKILPSVSNIITINDDSFYTQSIANACRINDVYSENYFKFAICESSIDTTEEDCDVFSLKEEEQNIGKLEDEEIKCMKGKNQTNHIKEFKLRHFSEDCISNSDLGEYTGTELNICDPNLKNCFNLKNYDSESNINYSSNVKFPVMKEAENLQDILNEFHKENNMLKKQLKIYTFDKNKNNTDSTNKDDINITTNFGTNCSYGCNLDSNIYSEIESSFHNVTLLDKIDALSDSALNIQIYMPDSSCQKNDLKMKDESHKMSNSSIETLHTNDEYCQDANELCEESESDECKSEVYQGNISRSSKQESMECNIINDGNSSVYSEQSNLTNKLNEETSQSTTIELSNLKRNTFNNFESDMLQEQEIHFMSQKNQKTKSISKYSLSDCSNSDESGKLSDKDGLKIQQLESNGSQSFIISTIGDSGPEENIARDIENLNNCNETVKITQERKELNYMPIAKGKKLPKKQKIHKIKVSINRKSSDYTNSKTDSKHNTSKSISDAAEVEFINEDPIKLISYYKRHKKSPQSNKTIKGNQYKNEVPFNKNGTDLIENKRKEVINRFYKQKFAILSQMGSNLRVIPIEKVDKLKIKPRKIEKVSSNIELKFLRKKDLKNIYLSEMQKQSKCYKDKILGMHEKSLLNDDEEINVDYTVQEDILCPATDDECLENMTPIRRNILDSSRLIRSPKYPSPITRKVTSFEESYPFKTFLIKSPKKTIVYRENHNYKLQDGYKICSTNNRQGLNLSLTSKSQPYNIKTTPERHVQYLSKYRGMSPDNLKLKFDELFKRYAGKGRCNGDLISHKRSTEWLRDAGIIGKDLTPHEATHAFKIHAGAKVALNKRDYRIFLRKLARVKRFNYAEVYEKLCEASSRWIEW